MDFKSPLTNNINPAKVAADYKSDLKRTVPTIDVAYVGKLLSDVFGVESPVYLPTWWQGRDYSPAPYPGLEVEADDPEYDDAPVRMGNKTFGAFWLRGGRYMTYHYTGELKEKSYPDFLMPLASIVDFTRPKTVNKTTTTGGSGTVKEIYGLGDWNITIKGIIIPDKDNEGAFKTVDGQMDMIQKYHEIAGSIEVDGQIFAKRNIYRITTEDLSFSPVQGRPNMMQYTIEATSDEDLLLTDIL
ncbi:DUF6046 domain-containing protein [Marinilabilia salmonicolor]|uniref:DUF6046 domain-containing protein n=1 Tax=Marinilabilia salmonicolor TaxID=989 RepID=UPI00029B2575|nr:DUF6046 domain-containing protein [Marinilabilia salmonicolor]